MTLNTAPAINIVPWSLYAPSVVTGTVSSPQGSAGPQTASAALITVNVEVQNSGPKNDSWSEDGGAIGETVVPMGRTPLFVLQPSRRRSMTRRGRP